MIEQHNLLNYAADEINAGHIRTTLDTVFSPINAENIRAAHALIETGKAKGKIVVEAGKAKHPSCHSIQKAGRAGLGRKDFVP